MCTNGTAVEGVCVTWRNPPVDCPGCEHGTIPVGRQVWRGLCKVGCAAPRLNEVEAGAGFAISVYDESV